eukprot:TRINITY_DN30789_c0_g1_i1.p1 TRINITY_DN30789_c0_g1~~TRINITY_DN30789_c0_g1_i1.p1  ORF type:complete len:331 (+),score=25.75 TRINITY_DN30789_c0_g1_i1:61-993(+)
MRPPRVALRSAALQATPSDCAYGTSAFDALAELGGRVTRGPHYCCQSVHMNEQMDEGSVVVLSPAADGLKLGRAAPSTPQSESLWGVSVECPATELARRGVRLPPRHPALKLAVVALVVDQSGRVLITRRTPHMRTFPSAWVFPGGSVDPGESVAVAAAREVQEETGLTVSAAETRELCLWESVYPTSADLCVDRGQIGGHAMVVFVVVDAPRDAEAAVKLQKAECDHCVWAPVDVLRRLHSDAQPCQAQLSGWVAEHTEDTDHGATVGLESARIESGRLHGIYPNKCGEGLGQGHLFALEMLWAAKAQL